jgi:hypothetical protein
MNFLRLIIKKIVKIEQNMLGRWNLDNCNKIINRKVDLANVDNCGPCGKIFIKK